MIKEKRGVFAHNYKQHDHGSDEEDGTAGDSCVCFLSDSMSTLKKWFTLVMCIDSKLYVKA